jgi:GH25 family lysozyme M1 (1,4-beta-N-acetylmuramidase)
VEWYGIDVSQWQGNNIDFNKVKAAGKKFVLLRAGFGKYTSQKDPTFEGNYKRAKAAGLYVGVYWYSYAKTVADAVAEAKACLAVIKGKQFEMPIYYDFEETAQFAKGKTFCSEAIKAFCNTMEAAGYFAGIYIYRSALQNYVTKEVAQRYALAVAEYGSRLNYDGDVGVWQYAGNTGRCDGVSGACDLDKCFVDYPSEIKAKGLNGFTKQSKSSTDKPAATKPAATKPAEKKAVDELAREVIAGKWSTGAERKKLITAAGYDYAAVQEKVNKLLAVTEYAVTDKTGLNIRAGAGITNKIVGSLKYGATAAVTDKKKVGSQYWGRLADGRGWICLTGFTKKVSK